MKIRIKSNELRYRLSRTDVARLVGQGALEDKISIGGDMLRYGIKTNDDSQLSAVFKNNTITLMMPKSMINELSGTERIGFENNDDDLRLLVEKDFVCSDNTTEDQSDNYPNPLDERFYEEEG